MFAKVTSCAIVGLEAAVVAVEVDVSSGLPSATGLQARETRLAVRDK